MHFFDNKLLLALSLWVAVAGCAEMQLKSSPPPASTQGEVHTPVLTPAPETDIYSRAGADRIQALEREVDRLKADLVRAESALIDVESRLRSGHSRANAVSSLAEAQFQLDKAASIAPWRKETIEAARDKLEIAQNHIDNEYFGAAVFFVYRVNRIVEELNYEAGIVDKAAQVMFINRPRVHLRAGPSKNDDILTILVRGTPVVREQKTGDWMLVRTLTGNIGWVHHSLVTSKERYKA